ncbi:MAG: hypothetical protein AAGG50_05105 [Bacteroidota bacterium]
MGQQQLLLLVLGIVIVGLAVASGIDAFEENRRKAEFDRLGAVGLSVAADVLAWKQKPAALGGGQDKAYLTDITIESLGYTRAENTNVWHWYGEDILVTFPWNQRDVNGAHINVLNVNSGIGIQVRFYGLSPDCVQFRRQVRAPGGSYGSEVQGWQHLETRWEDAGTIPNPCPATW